MEEEYEYIEEYEEVDKNESRSSKESSNVVNLSAIQQPTSRVMLCEPKSYNEVQEITDHLLNKRAVIINLQKVDQYQAKRIVDFLSGAVYAVNGNIQKTSMATFLCTPENIDVSGVISKSKMEDAEFNKGW